MDTNDKTAIRTLFDKLSEVARRFPDRDAEAERYIDDCARRQPGSLYYLAQTVITQEHALQLAEQKLRQAEADLEEARGSGTRGSGSFLSGLFGGGNEAPARGYGTVPSVPRGGAAPAASAPQPQYAPQQPSRAQGFLGGAAQTALGVAGGVMLGEMVGSMFGHHGFGGGFGGGFGEPEEIIEEREVIDDRSGGSPFDQTGFDQTGFDQGAPGNGGGGGFSPFDDAGGFDDGDDWT